MKSILLVVAALFAASAFAQAPPSKASDAKAPAPASPGACVITSNGLVTDMRDSNCFPQFDEAKCSYSMYVPMAKTTGASPADVQDTRKYGVSIMNYANARVCEGKPNCGFYVLQFATTATCDGKAEQYMPGGEYRGLTAAEVRNVQARINREGEAASKDGKDRGDKTKNPKHKGKVWGAQD